MITRLLRREYFPFVLLFIMLSIFVVKLGLYLDDTSYIFPSLVGNYTTHFANYIRDNGLNRPLALIYYYFIFTYYRFLPQIAHLIPLAIHVVTGVIIYKILKRYLSSTSALFTALLVTAIPFWAEAFSWFAASVGLVVRLIFYLQVYLIVNENDKKIIFPTVFVLQALASYLYETTILMPITLSFLLVVRFNQYFPFRHFVASYSKKLLILSLPGIVYVGLKILIPHSVGSEFSLSNTTKIFENISGYALPMYELVWSKGPKLFWYEGMQKGYQLLISSPIGFVTLFALLIYLLQRTIGMREPNGTDKKSFRIILPFWLTSFLLSLVPLVWKQDYLAFRTLALPLELGCITIAFLFYFVYQRWETGKNIREALIFFASLPILAGLLLQVSIVANITQQYRDDRQLAEQIDESNRNLGFTASYRTNVLVANIPSNTVSSFLYGDYIFSMFYSNWTAAGFIDLHSGTVAQIGIAGTDRLLSAQITQDEFMQLRPLTIYEFTSKENCQNGDCIALKEVLF